MKAKIQSCREQSQKYEEEKKNTGYNDFRRIAYVLEAMIPRFLKDYLSSRCTSQESVCRCSPNRLPLHPSRAKPWPFGILHS